MIQYVTIISTSYDNNELGFIISINTVINTSNE